MSNNTNSGTGRTFRVEVFVPDSSELVDQELENLASRAVLALSAALPGASALVRLGAEQEWGNLS